MGGRGGCGGCGEVFGDGGTKTGAVTCFERGRERCSGQVNVSFIPPCVLCDFRFDISLDLVLFVCEDVLQGDQIGFCGAAVWTWGHAELCCGCPL